MLETRYARRMPQYSGHVVASESRKAKRWDFTRLMRHYPLHGAPPGAVVPSKVIKVLVEVEQDGYGQGRVASWKDDVPA